jgi:C1A family cysteine protease
MDLAFEYIQQNGITTEQAYPYTAQNGQCHQNITVITKLSGHQDVPRDNQQALKAAVAQQPVSIAIEADQSIFQFYQSGVLTSGCGTALDHGVLLVGYGTEMVNGKATDYWLVKNSWGATWGDQGYIKLGRSNKTNDPGVCGIASQPSFPLL